MRHSRIENIGIALAVFKPDTDLFFAQLESIQSQSFEKWACIVTFDSPLDQIWDNPGFARFRKDSRFHWIQNSTCLGVKQNFQFAACTALKLNIDTLAFSDQDDIWYPEKLEILRHTLLERPPLSLVHSDMHLLFGKDTNLNLIDPSTTGWKIEKRGVKQCSLEHLLIRNCVAGAALLMDAELWRRYPQIPEQVPFHDHWAAILAAAHQGITAINKPLYAYRQHSANTLGITPYAGRFSFKKSDQTLGIIGTAVSRYKSSKALAFAIEKSGITTHDPPKDPLSQFYRSRSRISSHDIKTLFKRSSTL